MKSTEHSAWVYCLGGEVLSQGIRGIIGKVGEVKELQIIRM